MNRWMELTGETSGEDYAARFSALARSGKDVHGEARFCAALVPTGARVLDAGCGTGRVMIRLAELGYDCVGADLDASMLAVARKQAPEVPRREVGRYGPPFCAVVHQVVDRVLLGGSMPRADHPAPAASPAPSAAA